MRVWRTRELVPARLDLNHVGTAEQQLGLTVGTVPVYMRSGTTARALAEGWSGAAVLAQSLGPAVAGDALLLVGPSTVAAMVRFAGLPRSARPSSPPAPGARDRFHQPGTRRPDRPPPRQGSAGGRPPAFDPVVYAGRNVVARRFNRLKQFRGVAIRYAKRAAYYRAETSSRDRVVAAHGPTGHGLGGYRLPNAVGREFSAPHSRIAVWPEWGCVRLDAAAALRRVSCGDCSWSQSWCELPLPEVVMACPSAGPAHCCCW